MTDQSDARFRDYCELDLTSAPSFDGGVRGHHGHLHPPQLRAHREPGGWVKVEIEDGVDWLFPHLLGR